METLRARTALTPTGGFLTAGDGPGYTHTFNPAVGCAFAPGACGAFCYAREFAERLGGKGTWGERVLVKTNAPELIEKELERAVRRAPDHRHHVRKLRVFSSSTTDPCAGPTLATTRAVLDVVARYPIARWVLQTRSPRVVDLEEEILALGPRIVVSFTLETDDESLWRSASPGAPSIGARRRAFERMATWPVRRHLAVAPFLPCRDVEEFADWIADHATEATVDTFVSGDGSGGRRTARSPLPDWLSSGGFDWRDEAGARELLSRLQGRLGDRAAWSVDGFGRLAN